MLLGVVLVFIAAITVTANSAMSRIASDWPSIQSELRRSVASELDIAVARAADWAKTSAERAVRLPNGQYRPFRELDLLLNAQGARRSAASSSTVMAGHWHGPELCANQWNH